RRGSRATRWRRRCDDVYPPLGSFSVLGFEHSAERAEELDPELYQISLGREQALFGRLLGAEGGEHREEVAEARLVALAGGVQRLLGELHLALEVLDGLALLAIEDHGVLHLDEGVLEGLAVVGHGLIDLGA